MKLGHIAHDKLVTSRTNMRHGRKPPDVADILPSIRRRGVIVPLIVRPVADDTDGLHEIVAGLRRWTGDGLARAEGIDHGPLPVAFLEAGDDADAIEASLIENVMRRAPDEVTQWETFVKLVAEGRSPEDISATFAMPESVVKRILALGHLTPRIRDLYRKEKIDAATVRHLTMASKAQQKAWLALHDDPDTSYLPTGHQLKAWLFGGQSIRVEHALFDVEASGLAVVADLFGDERYFADADAFWTHQEAAVAAKRDAYLEAEWPDVVIVPRGERFSRWEHEPLAKRKGGRVYLDLRDNGEVDTYEGYVTAKEARRLAKGEAIGAKPTRPELTGTLTTYIDLHRHAAVRAALLAHPKVALRLMVAHAVAGSSLWTVRCEEQSTRNDEVRESVETCRGEADFDKARRAVLALLGLDAERPTVVSGAGGYNRDYDLVRLFRRLLDLPDRAVMDVIGIVIGETLASGSAAVEAVGFHIGVAMEDYWHADEAFFAALRDKEVLTRIVAETAGESVAAANAGEKGKTLKRIVRDRLEGANGREQLIGWVPKWMTFPPGAYTQRGGVGTVKAAALVAAALTPDEPDPGAAPAALPAPDAERRPEAEPQPLAA
jgi:ParB family chromosome partitioning protein